MLSKKFLHNVNGVFTNQNFTIFYINNFSTFLLLIIIVQFIVMMIDNYIIKYFSRQSLFKDQLSNTTVYYSR